MSDDRSDDGGLIDVTGYSLGDLATLDDASLERALDHILTVSDNSAGFHGFNNTI
jgi:FXSXX-COOH protein